MSGDVDISFNYKMFNPLFFHIRKAMRDDNIRFIFNIGGSSSGKSYSCAQAALVASLSDGCNILVLRKVGSSIRSTIYMDFETEIKRGDGVMQKIFSCYQNEIRNNLNGSRIDFKGLDSSEKIKGISQYKYIICDELTEFDLEDFNQLRKRMRGMRGQKMICCFNPISELHWIKKEIIDKETWEEMPNYLTLNLKIDFTTERLTKVTSKHKNKDRFIINPNTGKKEIHPSDMLLIKTTYLNNFWVVGSPNGKYGYYDRQAIADFEKDKENDYNYYRIYALAEWGVLKTGGEFLYNFDENINISDVSYNSEIPIRLSVDNNVLPYISVGFWQLDKDKNTLYQIHEIAAEEPNNTVTKAAVMTCEYLDKLCYEDVVIIHADASTTSRNTIDDKNKSFIDKFSDVIIKMGYKVVLSLPKKNPSVSMSCEFVNKLLADRRMIIDRGCKNSILDYLNAKRDANGGMMKKRIRDKATGQSYEQWGHFTDTLRYVGTYAFSKEYIDFSATRSRNPLKQNDYKFYEVLPPEKNIKYVEIYPNIDQSMVIISAWGGHDSKIYVDNIYFSSEKYDISKIPEDIVSGEVTVVVGATNKKSVSEIREKYEENPYIFIRGKRDRGHYTEKVDSWMPFIKESVFFNKDISQEALNNMLDYNGEAYFEVLTVLSTLCERIVKETNSKAS